jgi:hypothetical protein
MRCGGPGIAAVVPGIRDAGAGMPSIGTAIIQLNFSQPRRSERIAFLKATGHDVFVDYSTTNGREFSHSIPRGSRESSVDGFVRFEKQIDLFEEQSPISTQA